MHGDGEDLLGPVLADDVQVQLLLDLPRGGDVGDQRLAGSPAALLVVDDRLAQLDTFAADVDVVGPFDQGADVAVALAAERAVGVAVAAGAAAGSPRAAVGVFACHAIS